MKQVRNISLLNFFAALHYFLTIYILSPYLAQFMGDQWIGLVFAGGALLSLGAFLIAPALLSHISLKKSVLYIAGVELLILTALAFSPPLILMVPLIILLIATPGILGYLLDIFLEKAVPNEESTGMARGLFITAGSVAVVISPLVLGRVLGDGEEYWKMFAIAAGTLAVFVILAALKLKTVGVLAREQGLRLRNIIGCLLHSRDVVLGAGAHLMLQLFFTWVSIYIPLYLHTELGIPWSDLGFAFFIMLTPFVVLEFPIGYIADKWLGERELMILGFIITAGATISISFFDAGVLSIALIGALMMTRVGGAILEITTETYFFKHVSSSDVNTISLFRMLRPIGALIGPIIGSVALFFISLQWLFVVLGALTLIGIPFAFLLRDTR